MPRHAAIGASVSKALGTQEMARVGLRVRFRAKRRSLVHLDFAPNHRQPAWDRVMLATVVALAGSLLADALIVVIAQALMPSIKGYPHFQFGDYGKLTVIGVIIAC